MTPAMPSRYVRQLCTRVLIVVAGVVAGISAVWLFATSVASAAPAEAATGNLSAASSDSGGSSSSSSSEGRDLPLGPVTDAVGDARHAVETSAGTAAATTKSVARSTGKVASELGDKAAAAAEAAGEGLDSAVHAGAGQVSHDVVQVTQDASDAVRSTAHGVSDSTESWLNVPGLHGKAEDTLQFVNQVVFDKTLLAPFTVLGDIDGTFHGLLDEVPGQPTSDSGVTAATSPVRGPAAPRATSPLRHEAPDGQNQAARHAPDPATQVDSRGGADDSPRWASGALDLPRGHTVGLGQHDVQLGFLETGVAATPSHPLARVTAPALSRPAKQAVRPVNSPD